MFAQINDQRLATRGLRTLSLQKHILNKVVQGAFQSKCCFAL